MQCRRSGQEQLQLPLMPPTLVPRIRLPSFLFTNSLACLGILHPSLNLGRIIIKYSDLLRNRANWKNAFLTTPTYWNRPEWVVNFDLCCVISRDRLVDHCECSILVSMAMRPCLECLPPSPVKCSWKRVTPLLGGEQKCKASLGLIV